MWLTVRRWMARTIDTARVETAIRAVEARTSAEVRVSIARFFWGPVQAVAERAFDRLGMRATRERNGVLIFLVPSRRRFAVIGDAGIHERVGTAFWEQVAAAMSERFHAGDFTEGLVRGIETVGAALAEHFPHAGTRDVNELPDAVDFGSGAD